MSLRVISHTPNINATGVFLNDSITVTFDKQINTNTIDYTTMSVNDHSTFVSVPGSYSVVYCNESGILYGQAIGVSFTPLMNLIPNTTYDVYLYGKPDSILSYNNESINSTYSFSFTTGIEIWDAPLNSGVLPEWIVPEWTGTLHDIPPSVTGNITSFYVYNTYPKNQQPDVDITLSGIKIVFTGEIITPIDNLNTYITIDEEPVI